MRVGIFGGTFDPIHNGHLVIAEAVKDQLNLAEIIFVPAGQPWLKADWPISPAQHRLAMLRLALASKPYFKISDAELERVGPSYTVDTVEELRRKINAIFKHQSQKARAPFPGVDEREFWQRVEERNKATARTVDQLGLPEYFAMEALVVRHAK